MTENEKTDLQIAVDNGMIDLERVQAYATMKKREELLAMHPYSISNYKNGDWATYLPDDSKPNKRRFVRKKSEEDIKQAVVDYWREQIENPTICEVFAEWNDRRFELGKISNSTHLRNQQVFNRHYSDFGNRKIKTILQNEIEDFLEDQIVRFDLTAKGFANLKTITKGFLIRAKKKGLISFNVSELFSDMDISDISFQKKIREDRNEVFDEVETEKILNYLAENFDIWNAGIMFMFLTGVRVGELAALKHEDFDDDNSVRIRRTEVKYKDESGKYQYLVKDFPKTQAGVRTVVIPKDYTAITRKIRLISPFGEYLFMHNGHRITTNSFRTRLRHICEKLNITPKSPHKIRKTYASILLDCHTDKELVLQLMGHTTIGTTEGYYHRNRRSQQQKVEIISAIPEFRKRA